MPEIIETPSEETQPEGQTIDTGSAVKGGIGGLVGGLAIGAVVLFSGVSEKQVDIETTPIAEITAIKVKENTKFEVAKDEVREAKTELTEDGKTVELPRAIIRPDKTLRVDLPSQDTVLVTVYCGQELLGVSSMAVTQAPSPDKVTRATIHIQLDDVIK